MRTVSIEALFGEYLAIVNRAIAQNRDRVPYKQLFAGGKKLLSDRTIAVEVYDGSATVARFTLGIDHDRLTVMEPGEAGQGEGGPTWTWKVSHTHLDNVVAEPQPYIESPIKLDLDWLETRIKD